jgi:ribosomal protein L11 methyltransferase
MPIAIETAGIHPSTGLCLEALQWLHEDRDFENILDMGCGNGILSTVAASIWEAKVLAVDISEKALADAEKNITDQNVDNLVTLLRSDGFLNPMIRQRSPYDLIICNMLAEFTVETAREVKNHLAKGGICLLAGILAWKADGVETAYAGLGFEIIKEIKNSPWCAYILSGR